MEKHLKETPVQESNPRENIWEVDPDFEDFLDRLDAGGEEPYEVANGPRSYGWEC